MIEWCSFYGGGDIPKCQLYRGLSIVEVGAVHGHAKTGDYQWTFSHSRRILRLRRIINLQNPSNLTEKPMDKVRRIAHPIKNVPFSLSDRNYPTDNPS